MSERMFWMVLVGLMAVCEVIRFYRIRKEAKESRVRTTQVLGSSGVLKVSCREGMPHVDPRAIEWGVVAEVVKVVVKSMAKEVLIIVLERVLEELKSKRKSMSEVTADDIREVLCETRGEMWRGKVVEDLGEEGDETAVKAVLAGIGLVREYGRIGGKRIVLESHKPGWARNVIQSVRAKVFGFEGEKETRKDEAASQASEKPAGGKKPNGMGGKPARKPEKAQQQKKKGKKSEKMDAQFYGDGEDW